MKNKIKMKRIALAALSFLIISGCGNKKNNYGIEPGTEIIFDTETNNESKEFNLEKEYNLDDLYIMICNNGDGKPKYYFVKPELKSTKELQDFDLSEYIYESVTTEKIEFFEEKYYYHEEPYLYESIPDISASANLTHFFSVPDHKVEKAKVEAKYFPMPEKYKNKKKYSGKELMELEEILNAPTFDMYDNRANKNIHYAINSLVAMYTKNSSFICTSQWNIILEEAKNPEDVTTIRRVYYCPRITNPSMGIKLNYGMNVIEENKKGILGLKRIPEAMTSSDFYFLIEFLQNAEDSYTISSDLSSYLTSEQINRGYLTYEEVIDLEYILSKQNEYNETEEKSR